MRRRAPRRSSELRRRVRWGAVLGSALAAFVVASVSLAGLSSLASGGPQTIVTKRIFPGPRSLAAQDVRDASSGAETNKSDAFSYADAVVTPTSTAIASGTNLYLDFTMNSGRPGGLSVSSPVFNFRLASGGGAQAGNACFWFEVRSGGSVIGTHGSYASAAGCSAGTTQTTISTAIAEVTSTDQVNGLVRARLPLGDGRQDEGRERRPRDGQRLDALQHLHRLRDAVGRRHQRHARDGSLARGGGRRHDLHGRDRLAGSAHRRRST